MVDSTYLTRKYMKRLAAGEHDDTLHQKGLADGPVTLTPEMQARLREKQQQAQQNQRFDEHVNRNAAPQAQRHGQIDSNGHLKE